MLDIYPELLHTYQMYYKEQFHNYKTFYTSIVAGISILLVYGLVTFNTFHKEQLRIQETMHHAFDLTQISHHLLSDNIDGQQSHYAANFSAIKRKQKKVSCRGKNKLCDKLISFNVQKSLESLEKYIKIKNVQTGQALAESLPYNNFDKQLIHQYEYYEKLMSDHESKHWKRIFIVFTIVFVLFIVKYFMLFRPFLKDLFMHIDALNIVNMNERKIAKEKNKILNDITQNLRTPLNELSYATLDESNMNMSYIVSLIKRISHSVEFLLSVHEEEILKRNEYSYLINIKDKLMNEVIDRVKVSTDRVFYKFNTRSIINLLNSSYLLAKSLNVEVCYNLHEGVEIEFQGPSNALTPIEALLQELDSFPSLFSKSFLQEIKKHQYELIKNKNTMTVKIEFENYDAVKGFSPIKKALIVDDIEMNILSMKTLLNRLDIEVDSATDGFEALKKLEGNEYDILFLDVAMPVLDGFEVLEMMRKKKCQIHTVMASGKAFDKDIFQADRLGAHSYVVKPITMKKIDEEIDFAQQFYGKNKFTHETSPGIIL